MSAITAESVKKLRDMTNLPMMECKSALGEAVACVESGMRVYIHPGCAEPEALVEALMVARALTSTIVEMIHLLTLRHLALLRAGDGGAFPPQRTVRRRQRARGRE